VSTLLQHSPLALLRHRMSYRVFTNQTPEIQSVLRILSWALIPLQRKSKHRAATLNLWFSKDSRFRKLNLTCSAFHEVLAPSAFPHLKQRFFDQTCQFDPAHLQVFATSWCIQPLRVCRSYFVPDPLLGFTLQSLFPLTQPTLFPTSLPS